MKVYLVGGAVRDQLLGYPITERDFVIVGATPQDLLQKGYQQVGKDFPVFLHPQTREEYALARTERKLFGGYYGFACDFNPHVRLEEDLARRDLTINAMAMDEEGNLIDPFHGQDDLRLKQLRHVSPAFVEDPVRVLRVARFAARYHHLGFSLAEETRQLMLEMVKAGELAHLVPERVWQEWCRSLGEKNPEQFILLLRHCGALQVVIPELDTLFGIPNPATTQHNIDSGLQALDALVSMAKITEDAHLRFAALLHNFGTRVTPMTEWPVHKFPREAIGQCVNALGNRLRIPNDYSHLARLTAQCYHTIHQLPRLDAENVVNLFDCCDAYRRPQGFEDLLAVCTGITANPGLMQSWLDIRDRCRAINPQAFIQQGYQGRSIKQMLHQARLNQVNVWKKRNEK